VGLTAIGAEFDRRVLLGGYVWPLGEFAPAPGKVLPLSLVWKVVTLPTPDYAIALRLLGPEGEVWKADNPAPVLGMLPFGLFQLDQVVADYYEVPLSADLLSGHYELRLALYQTVAGGGFERATATDSSGQELGELVTVLTFELTQD
jgi:hypothetical protein